MVRAMIRDPEGSCARRKTEAVRRGWGLSSLGEYYTRLFRVSGLGDYTQIDRRDIRVCNQSGQWASFERGRVGEGIGERPGASL